MALQHIPTVAPARERPARRTHGKQQVITSMCGICDAGCGVKVYVEDGMIHHIEPLPDHPRGSVCPRGMRAREIVYSKDRLLYPLKRVGPKGTDAFERISWDEALETIVSRLRHVADRYGPEALCMYTGRGNFEHSLMDVFAPAGTRESSASSLFFPFGSPNTTGVGAICYVAHGKIAPQATFGAYTLDMFNDVDQADLIVGGGRRIRPPTRHLSCSNGSGRPSGEGRRSLSSIIVAPEQPKPPMPAGSASDLAPTERGRVPFKARVTADIVPGVVEVSMGGGGPIAAEAWRRANVNDLTDSENRDPISGFPVYKALLCDVVKA